MKTKQIVVIDDTCDQCGTCIAMCPENAIAMTDGPPVIDDERCRLCEACVTTCAMGALQFRAILSKKPGE